MTEPTPRPVSSPTPRPVTEPTPRPVSSPTPRAGSSPTPRAGSSPTPRPAWAPPSLESGDLRDPRLGAALRSLELSVRRRLDGLLQGNHLGLLPGPGREPGEVRAYSPGDDVRRMDWSVTARTTEAHIRQTVADRELETWVALDLSPSLDFGTAACEKRDLAVAALAAITHLTAGGGNRIGAVIATGATTVRVPALPGVVHAQRLLRTAATTPRAADGTRGDLGATLEALRRPPRRRGLAVVISDFLGEIDWDRSLRGLAVRHDLLAVEVLDPRDVELPDVGRVVLSDPESGRTRELSATPRLRADFAAAAQAHRRDVDTALRRAGCARLTLRTDSDWIADVVRFVVSRKRGWSGGSRG